MAMRRSNSVTFSRTGPQATRTFASRRGSLDRGEVPILRIAAFFLSDFGLETGGVSTSFPVTRKHQVNESSATASQRLMMP